MLLRLARIAAIAVLLPALFTLSQRVGEARGNPPIPGMLVALGALSALFLVRAIVTEKTQGPALNLQKDLLWGVGIGGLLVILVRLA